jgi:hypothetical protein
MFMPFDRQHQPARQTRFTPMADATGTPFTGRHSTDQSRPATSDPRDFREQADGAP